eukprot:3637118-Lingulodinium_polyedra.AAC.1
MAFLVCQAYFAGEPAPQEAMRDNGKDISAVGLAAKVIKYAADDDDRGARACWNVARRDEESFTARRSS